MLFTTMQLLELDFNENVENETTICWCAGLKCRSGKANAMKLIGFWWNKWRLGDNWVRIERSLVFPFHCGESCRKERGISAQRNRFIRLSISTPCEYALCGNLNASLDSLLKISMSLRFRFVVRFGMIPNACDLFNVGAMCQYEPVRREWRSNPPAYIWRKKHLFRNDKHRKHAISIRE